MINPNEFLNELTKLDLNFFTGVPDSLLKNFLTTLNDLDYKKHIIATNEGSAIGIAIGYNLSTNKVPMVYLQNSGLGNIINPILSLADKEVYSIPMIIMVGWRGEPDIKDEPQHLKQGRVTLDLIESMNYHYEILSKDLDKANVQMSNLIKLTKEENKPVFVVVKKDTFSKTETVKKEHPNKLERESAIKEICKSIENDDLIISTTGKSSRELYEVRKTYNKQNDFLTVGGMGHANQIALGVALFSNKKNVYCIDGDGAILMHMGGLVQIANAPLENLCHIIINNYSHESVGGQPTLGDKISFSSVCKSIGYTDAYRVSDEEELKKAIKMFKQKKGIFCIEVLCSSSSRNDLGRPTTSPLENKVSFKRKIVE